MDLAANVEAIQRHITAACTRAGRDPRTVQLMAVSKGHPPEAIRAVADTGLTLFGESKIQEAKVKIPQCPSRLHWQMIGHLQSNKVKDAVQLFEMIQSVDSLSLAEELNKRAEQSAKTLPILLEVNVAGESSKFGYGPESVLAELEQLNSLKRLELHGLMTIAPYVQDVERVRPFFRKLRQLKEQCEQQLGAPLPVLSMGMSGDFEVAIEEGSTLVRVGTAIFGERTYTRPVASQD
ncbi:MAG: YggS family pyridoxal phosphate-dependent enzyme [Verrucomicrobia bacterium]|jgi:pyridoxal phosphate enzyme (YggS family)|nr:YggS family pyridoxal phosphate-dependent enzyme [Verrucomicrobiota bacterium]